jgi:hypothetical protein
VLRFERLYALLELLDLAPQRLRLGIVGERRQTGRRSKHEQQQ